MLTGEATEPLDGRSQLESSCCPKVWTMKQHVVALSSAESEQNAAVKTASEGLEIQSVARTWEYPAD